MKRLFYILLLTMACTGSLTPEQREKARKAIEEGQIKRITPAALTEQAMAVGKQIALAVNGKDPFLNNKTFTDSVANAHAVKIYALRKDTPGLSDVEKQVAEAYETQGDVSGVPDNLQKLAGDSLLYTMPIGNERPDGSKPFSHAIAIKMAVKNVVMGMEK
jgi:hypothetical protein